jgi:hypothetical protein
VATGDGDEFSHAHCGTQEGNFHERLLEEDAVHAGEGRKEDGGVEIRDMVREEDAGLAGRNVFAAFDANADAGSAYSQTLDRHTPAVHGAEVTGQCRQGDADQGGGDAKNEEDEEHF